MSDWLIGMFSGGAIDPQSPMVRFEFAHPLAAWQWALVIIGGGLLAWWSYARLEGSAVVRVISGCVRWITLVLLVVLLCGPRLVEVDERVERDWVLTLVDRSGSMTIADMPDGTGGLMTREAQLRQMLGSAEPVFAEMAGARTLKWLGFDGGAFELAVDITRALPLLEAPTGLRTDLPAAVEQALAKGAARPIAGVVIFSDGRSSVGREMPRALLRRLNAEKIPVIVVPLGSPDGLIDLAIGSVVAPPTVFVNDPVPVRARLTRSGQRLPGPTRVRLIDRASGETLDEVTVDWASDETARELTLTGRAAAGERTDWSVQLLPSDRTGEGGGSGDLIAGNNAADVRIGIVDRPLRLLYVDGYPRWEYRFLKNIFTRDQSISFNALLLSAGRRYIGEGSEEIESLPDTVSGWDAFDVIMIGDVQPGVLSRTQMEQIRTRVSVGGAGLLWIAGQSAVPGAYRSSPLADLLPVAANGWTGSVSGVSLWDRDVVIKPTPLADALGVLRLTARQDDGTYWPQQASDPASGWSRFRWMQRLDATTLKPAAEALALAIPVDDGEPRQATAAVVTMRYGAGRIVYVATDEVWRFRYGRGEDLPERFYTQLIRLLGRESVARSGKPALLSLTPHEAEVGGAVRVSVELIDQSLIDTKPTGLTVRLVKNGSEEQTEVSLKSGESAGGGARSFVGTWVPVSAGTWTAVATDALLEGKGVSTTAEVSLADDELRRPEADHALLRSLAQETGGTVLSGESLGTLRSVLPNREVRTLSVSRQESLWDRPLVLWLLVGLLGFEWVLRRVIRLV